jgi:DNA-binding MarR family transcriptional regulator
VELSEEIEVSVDELRVLHAHAQLAQGYSMSVSDVAATLGARKHDMERLLSRLVRLNLIRSTLGGPDGESAYTLTSAGQAFLLFRRMTAGNMRRTPPAVPAVP